MKPTLFDPLTLGPLILPNRVIMAPLTRGRAGDSRTPNALMAEYYAQRAGAGLIVSEATAISPAGYGWRGAPGIYTDTHEAGWKIVTNAVHKVGGRIFLQLWHMGRVSHPDLQDGVTPVAPSAIAAEGFSRSLDGDKPYVVPRAMTKTDIIQTIDDYAAAAARAIRAGFDGVEIHGANGYLIDQFLRENANTRNDEYGGSIENRVRFLAEVTEAVVAVAGAERTGIRLSPMNGYNSMHDSDLEGLFTAAAKTVNRLRPAYLHIREPSARPLTVTPLIRKSYDGMLIANDGYDQARAQSVLSAGHADAVAFGIPFIANPDLVARYRHGTPLNEADPKTYYRGTAAGYIDYPSREEAA